jgi:ABC-type multidrug transport system fused ATPase/permease subunit
MHFDKKHILYTKEKPIVFKNNIKLCDVSYGYPKMNKKILNQINLEIPIGSSVGLIGKTGAGKTTIGDILLGLLLPDSGQLLVDGVNIDNTNMHSWQLHLGYVPQDIYLADMSIAENIALGISGGNVDYAQVRHCAQMAQIDDFIINELPDKYNTVVGERGVKLSGGQRQRIGIARALYKKPSVLVFDEATSALDMETEKALMKELVTVSKGRTLIVIAHRLTTVENCDIIINVADGNIQKLQNFKNGMN